MTKLSDFTPHADKVFVTELESGPRKTQGGLIIPDDNMKESGIRSRWARVVAIGKNVDEVAVGEWVLLEHGRWTYGIPFTDENGEEIKIWHVDFPSGVLLVSETDPRSTHKVTL